MSKEIWVLEHEFLAGIEFYIVIAMIIKYVGKPIIAPMVDKAGQEDDAALAKIRQDEIDKYKTSIDAEKGDVTYIYCIVIPGFFNKETINF